MDLQINRRYIWPNFLDWLVWESRYSEDVYYRDDADPDDWKLYISHEFGSIIIEDLLFEVDQEDATITITITDPQPDSYDDLWKRVLEDFMNWAKTNSRELPELQINLVYQYGEDDAAQVEK